MLGGTDPMWETAEVTDREGETSRSIVFSLQPGKRFQGGWKHAPRQTQKCFMNRVSAELLCCLQILSTSKRGNYKIRKWAFCFQPYYKDTIPCQCKKILGPGRVAQLVRTSSQYTKVADPIPSQGTYKNQPVNAQIRGTTNRSIPSQVN